MNEKEIAFIISTNNEQYMEECRYYISKLYLPDGYKSDIIEIRDAASMCAAYNMAMKNTDAKYKIYMHQDVFLTDSQMIVRMLEIFEDKTIGMIGVAGAKKLSNSATAALEWNTGNVYVYNSSQIMHMKELQNGKNVTDVCAVDGMLMITQYDMPWDEVTFDAFHFYDISQCMEFRKKYRIVVPGDETVWALHDSGISSYEGYDVYRKRFCEKYQDAGFLYLQKDNTYYSRVKENLKKKKYHILSDVENKMVEQLQSEITQFEESGYVDNEIFKLKEYVEIILEEKKKHGFSNTEKKIGWKNFTEFETQLRFLLWRMEYTQSRDAALVISKLLQDGIITLDIIKYVIAYAVLEQQKVWKQLADTNL